jgi:hypothetical protein
MRVKTANLVLAILFATCQLGCLYTTDSNSGEDLTRHRLEILKRVLTKLEAAKKERHSYETLSTVLSVAKDCKYLAGPDEQIERFGYDGWGMPFRWTVKDDPRNSNSIVIQIVSDGNDRASHNRKPNEISVSVVVKIP